MKIIKLFEEFSTLSDFKIYENPDFVNIIEETIEPSSFICSFVASAVKMLEGDNVKIYGFDYYENPTSEFFSQEELREGHHFAVVNDRFIIDPWIYEYYTKGVFDLYNDDDKDIIKHIYGDKENWTDITATADDFKKLFPNKYQYLIEYYNKYKKKIIN